MDRCYFNIGERAKDVGREEVGPVDRCDGLNMRGLTGMQRRFAHLLSRSEAFSFFPSRALYRSVAREHAGGQ